MARGLFRPAVAVMLLLASALVVGCGGPQPRDAEPPVPGGSATPVVSTAPPTGSLPTIPGVTPSAPSSTAALRFSQTDLTGRSGSLTWRVRIPVFAGSDAVEEINRRIRASAQDAITAARHEAKDDNGEHRSLTGESVVTTNDGRTVQVTCSFTDNLAGTAHPTYAVSTTVVTSLAGDPVVLADVFLDEQAAFTALARDVTRIAKAKDEQVTDPSGLAPKEKNWAAWQTTPLGMGFSFQDYQLGGHGLRAYTVPWATVRPLMSDSAKALLAPPQ